MSGNWIKLHRKLLDSDTFKNEKLLKIWIWILLKANHKDNTFLFGREIVSVKRGQFIMGLNRASEHLDLAKNTIHYWVNYLEKIGKVGLKKTNKYTIITIQNYDLYQDVGLKKNSKRTLKETNKNDIRMIKNDNNNISKQSLPVNEIMKEFYEFNPTLNFGNINQRKAVEELIKKFGEDKLLVMIKQYRTMMSDRFCPIATTPIAFKSKLGDIIAFFNKKQSDTIGGRVI